MNIAEIIFIAFGLAMDAFAVSIAISAMLKSVEARQTLRLSLHFGMFQAIMPIIGWLAGLTVAGHIERFDHWAAFALLCFIGGRMIYSGFAGDGEINGAKDPTRGLTVLALAVATSVDALAVGLSFAMLGIPVWLPAFIIGAVAFAMTVIGMKIGSRLGARFGQKMEIIGGLALVAIGFKIVIEHIL